MSVVMRKEIKHIFMLVDGMWVCVSGTFFGTLAEFLALSNIIIDDDCQFCRIKRVGETIEYRHNDALRITITITTYFSYEQTTPFGD